MNRIKHFSIQKRGLKQKNKFSVFLDSNVEVRTKRFQDFTEVN